LDFLYPLKNYGFVIIVSVLAATPLFKEFILKLRKSDRISNILNILEIPFLIALLVAVTAFLVDGSFNPFLYFRF